MKKIALLIIFLIILSLSFFIINPDIRRSILTYVFVTHDYYQLKSLMKDAQVRDFDNASKKLSRYINISKKLTNDSSYMINGIYDAVELVINRAVLQDDYNKLENVIAELVRMEPNSYKPNVWLARAYSDNKPKESIILLEKAISISPAQEEAYREILRIAQIYNIENLNEKYCKLYPNTQLGGFKSTHYTTLFNSNNLRRFALNLNQKNHESYFYTNDGMILNKFYNYEFALDKLHNIDHVNLFFSFLPGVNLQIKSIELFSNDNKFIVGKDQMLITTNNAYFYQSPNYSNEDFISLIFTTDLDEIVRIKFKDNKIFKKIEKINILMNFKKLNLTNTELCK
tara:strand:+ start:4155 stop:5180 length:1026 start_codon:yes stop_codon:yes gene_type:complete